MDVIEAVKTRRAFRSLEPVAITEDLIRDLARSAQLAPSCFNNQPARFVFVYKSDRLKEMHQALTGGNVWAKAASLIIAVFSKAEDDCIIRDREYHQFDVGLSVGFLILRATELGLVAHPIAGFSPKKTREILGIPDEYKVIALVIVGKHSEKISPVLSDEQIRWETSRPRRKSLEKIASYNIYSGS